MSKVFQFKQPHKSTGFLLWQVNNLWQREINKVLKEFYLTHTQFVVLAGTYLLSLKNDNLMQIMIAEHLKIDPMTTSNVLRTLLKKGLIDRIEHETDTRAKIIKITKNGDEILKKAIEKVKNFDKDFFNRIINKKAFKQELVRLLDDQNDC
ncbi:MAG TPA: MarR family transcriptional regulator [Ignavibacteria bacterium]|nr:MarR family transcriptional regulator [Ignavibacteria bacterium]